MSQSGETGVGYWYGDQEPLDVLLALRRFRRADDGMRRRMGTSMSVNPLDLRALQLIVAAERSGLPCSPSALSTELHISTAATTKLIDRLTHSGHAVRSPHPHDRRSVILTATPHTHDELQHWMTELHRRMAGAAAAVPPESREVVVGFLHSMADVMDAEPSAAPSSND